ncbi:MAG: hypothetical protein CMC55_06960 [Flavobacteriaceae bacterium]|uniref:hypothetical protein n=1 Tax=Bizionia echini TaxID=649333 RepID=UPI000C997897|nr:hypothetical protein [Flavobacteriaceae bacterium]
MTPIFITLPKRLTYNSLYEIIRKFNFIFKIKDRGKPGYVLDLSKVLEVDIVGMLILYKFIEFAAENKCFELPTILYEDDSPIHNHIEVYGFEELINTHIRNDARSNTVLNNLSIRNPTGFFIAPQALIRNNAQTKKKFDIEFKNELDKLYGHNATTFIESILICAVEISSNFYNHAIDDTKSIILARGSKNFIEIACADTAKGLINTLKQLEKYNNIKDLSLMKKAFEPEVTSKPSSNHMGYGLWLIKEIIRKYDGILDVYSSEMNFSIKHGREKIKKSPNWNGSIIYLKLPVVLSGIDIGDILRARRTKKETSLKINFS